MQLRVVTKEKNKFLKDVVVGDLLLCEDGNYMPVKNKMIIACKGFYYRLSNGTGFHISPRTTVKTTKGFIIPELWDSIEISKNLLPIVTTHQITENNIMFYDILIDGNIVSPEGIIFRFG